MLYIPSLSEYVDNVKQGFFHKSLSTCFEDAAFSLHALCLARSKRKHPFVRRRHVKKMLSALLSKGCISSYRTHFKWFMKTPAYMLDTGDLYFSMRSLFLSDGADLCKIVLHELSHLWLYQQEGYGDLLRLDKQFLKLYGSKNSALTLSPVERYATEVSVCIMQAIFDGEDVFNSQIEKEKDKILNAHFTFFNEIKENSNETCN
jgi:hypothetical protein